jgi:ABC-type glycerol-3-phosphate transport system substrate-binding protein
MKTVVFFLLVAVLLLSACDQLGGDAQTSPPLTPTTNALATRPPSDPPRVPLLATPEQPPQEAGVLRVWIPPAIAVSTDAGAAVLSDQLLAYDTNHPEFALTVAQKEVSGPGGLLSYLRTGRDVAPAILPDLVAIPSELLPVLAGENLIVPLGEGFDEDALEGLFPPAEAMAQPGDNTLGYPFVLTGLPHLAYNSNVLTGTLPLTWQNLIAEDERSMVFAADGPDGAVLALQFYLDAGGQITAVNGQPSLELEPLVTALEQLEDGREQDFFIPQSSTLSTTAQVWQTFLSGGANIAHTVSDHYLAQATAGLPVSFTVIPGLDRPLTPLVGGWAWAITTTNPVRQVQALNLLQDLVAPSNLARWSEQSNLLPADRDALALWADEPYVGFARQELERAQALPVSTSGRVLTVLSDAVFQVVSGARTAQQAAEEAVAAMQG